ncbi:MAG: HEAT repeat domain-containing protein [Isosphaeraceae bacterium]
MKNIIVSLSLLVALAFAAAPPTFGQKAQGAGKDDEARLIGVLNKSDASRKAKADACRELGRVGTHEAVAPLAALLDDEELSHMARYGLEPIPDPAVDAAFRQALGKLHGKHLVGVIGSVGVRRDPRAVDALAQKLGDSDPEVAQAAARALGRIGNLEAVAALEKALASAGDANRLSIGEGLLRAADVLRTQGQRKQAGEILEKVREAKLPEYVREGAKRAEESLRARTR